MRTCITVVVVSAFALLVACAGDDGPGSCGDAFCGAGESCSSCPGDCGACAGDCGPANCAGCCGATGVCQGGTAADACGTGGGACVSCGTGLACGGGGTCALDPASRWNLVIDYLDVPTTNYAGDTWDAFGGAPDPIIYAFVGGTAAAAGMVNTADDMFTFALGTTAVTNARASDIQSVLGFEVYDEDVSDIETIGGCLVSVTSSTFSGATQSIECPANPASGLSGFSLDFHLEPY